MLENISQIVCTLNNFPIFPIKSGTKQYNLKNTFQLLYFLYIEEKRKKIEQFRCLKKYPHAKKKLLVFFGQIIKVNRRCFLLNCDFVKKTL